jgi:lisH domain-containing protein FOPNL
MASINELKEVLKETLEERGVLSQIRARIRAEIFSTLNDVPPNRPDLSNENLIINELIREYLTFNGYQHTLAVFLPESGQPTSPPFERNYITKQLKIVEDRKSQELPLIYGLTFGNKKPIDKKEAE